MSGLIEEISGEWDVVVVGSGGAGLMAALSASEGGLRVLVVERTDLIGGTTAISGGGIWAPGHPLLPAGESSEQNASLAYLERLTLGTVDIGALQDFVENVPRMVRFLMGSTGLKMFSVDRHDYHPDWPGARVGRSIEPLPFDTTYVHDLLPHLRHSPTRPPVTSKEARSGLPLVEIQSRRDRGVRTQGGALVAGLVQGCIRRKVEFRLGCRVTALRFGSSGCDGVIGENGEEYLARRGVILASGGFEWNRQLVKAYLPVENIPATTPPANEGDGLLMGLRAGAAVDNMSEAWWTAAVEMEDQQYDHRPFTRNIVRELALPGSILVNQDGKRFVNEASSYNDLGKAFLSFDPSEWRYPNLRAFMIFDEAFRVRYPILGMDTSRKPPNWMVSASTLDELAQRVGVDPQGLLEQVDVFNADAALGFDGAFGRGGDAHGLYYADETFPGARGCLAPLAQPPFHAIPIVVGNNGTKGGLLCDLRSRVIGVDGSAISGLFACGNVSASIMGPGYPGHGGSLGPILTSSYTCGRHLWTAPKGD
jgi:succinate dehydrogenase/fumarate reductase flavoprotein subunit